VPNDGHTSAPTEQPGVGLTLSEHVVTGRGEHSPAVVVGVVDDELGAGSAPSIYKAASTALRSLPVSLMTNS
jgi:hypothetical protein